MELHHPGTNQMLLLYVNKLDSNLPVRNLIPDNVMRNFVHLYHTQMLR